MEDLTRLAQLIKARNQVTSDIAMLVERPALIGHVGEYIAARIFDIVLEESASCKGIDGHFTKGELAGHSVNIKWYPKREGLLDLTPEVLPEFYLVLAGPRAAATTSRGTQRPWVVDAVYLFDACQLVSDLRSRGVNIGIATSVRRHLWEKAEIYPDQRNDRLALSGTQRELLALFQ